MERLKSLKKSYKIAITIALITFLWVLSGAIFNSEEAVDSRSISQRETAAEANLQTVRVMDITSEKMMQSISLSGKTIASRMVNLKAETSGRVESVDFVRGSEAITGTTLISLAIDDRDSRLDKATANLEAKKITYNAKIKLQEKQLSSTSAVAAAKSAMQQAEAEVELAELNLAHTKIKAPFDGIIEDRFVEVGDFVSIGQNLIEIVDLNPIKAVGYVSENIRANVSIGSKATVVFNHKEVEAVISYISSSADEATRTYKFEVKIPNEDNSLTEGLTCSIKVDVATLTAHSISPSLIVLNDQGEIGIRVINEENIVKFLPVEFLTDENEKIWLSGLPDEFTIITVGHEYVKDGSEVLPTYEEDEE